MRVLPEKYHECDHLLVFSRLCAQKRQWVWVYALGPPLIIGA